MNIIHFLLSSSWKMVTLAIVTGLFSGASSAGLIALIGNSVSNKGYSSSPVLAWGFVGLVLIVLLTSIFSQVVLIKLAQDAVFQLQLRLSRQILASELSELEQLGTPRLLATLTEDVQAISQAVFSLPLICINLAIVGGCLLYVAWLSPQVLLMILVLLVIAISSSNWFFKKGRQMLALAREEQDILFNHFRTISEGVKELKLHYQRRQDFLAEDLTVAAANFRRHNFRGLSLFAVHTNWGKLIFFFAIGAVLFLLPKLITINPQTVTAYVLTFTYLIAPMETIVNKLPLITKADVSLKKIEVLGLALASHAEEATVKPTFVDVAKQSLQPSWSSLELRGVTHAYGSDREDLDFILGPIDLKFKPGEIVFLIGGNGSGKSTLAKLITGLYIPESGKIWLDNQPINQQNREWYRQHFSVVFSDFYLFDRLLGFGQSNLDSVAEGYLRQLQLDHKVKVENGKLSTTALSQGQRKRLALLTAYLEDRPIYLFDEWASDQDPIFKELFYTELLPKLRNKGKLVLVISHDDQYFEVGDRVIKLDYGKLIYDKAFV
ncbi:ABC transporter ATP-binding protein [[Phormidium ambiguum] IAM M-71]|uniref:ABC transporter ATP-binding protein n=1 Tax=[Phormidium ambiguum] IAM M-71 TaxID=454136 RepID=A0A1U7ITR1_9CYAN|nr:cyclic peptide export ABC transporter [Phormidium ambiguum]OKH40841.1 ABC transporter ATP-binding protein [Phormidium ambiguum IAM M-71]